MSRSTTFLSSHPDIFDFKKKYPYLKDMLQIVIAGRSNVGKSSFINYFFKKKIAKTAKVPGKTRLLNFFRSSDDLLWVDTPGYGVAKVSRKQKELWRKSMQEFFLQNNSIFMVLLLLDIRHFPSEDDLMFLDFLKHYKIKYAIVFTKVDKVKNFDSQAAKILDTMDLDEDVFFVCSSVKFSTARRLLNGYICRIKNLFV